MSCCREGRYDSVSKADAKVQKAWRQKSLDEKKLRFVMKRTSIPAQDPASSFVNHGVLSSNHKAASTSRSASAPVTSDRPGGRRRTPRLTEQQQHLYIDDFSDYDCLLENADEEARDACRAVQVRDGECQTGDDLVQAMFLQLRRRRFQTSAGGLDGDNVADGHPFPPHPPVSREFHPVKEVTFDAHVVPVSRSPPPSNRCRAAPEALPLLARRESDEGGGVGVGTDVVNVDVSRRLSDLSPLCGGGAAGVDAGGSSPEPPAQNLPRRRSDTSDMFSSHSPRHSSIYHRPPTPRTPRKLLIQNHLNGDNSSLPQTFPSRDSLPSPHLLHVQDASSSRNSSSSTSVTSAQTSRGEGVCEEEEATLGRREKEAAATNNCAVDESVIEFQQYLFDRGLSLDMSTVQTSNL